MPDRTWKCCFIPTDDPVAANRTRSFGPQSWLPWLASASRRCASTLSAWAPTTISGQALAEEDDVASGLRDEELKSAASQIRAIGAAASAN